MNLPTEHIPLRSHVLLKMDAPLVARAALLGEEEEPSAAMDKGSTCHAILFNTQTVVVFPGERRTGKAWEAFEAEHDGCRIVTKGDYELASRMADAIRRDAFARPLLEYATFEQTRMFKLDDRLCRATPDIVGRGEAHIVDVKTCKSAKPERFRYNARDYGYHQQLAWYKRAVPAAKDCFIVCVEKAAPYAVSVFRLSPRCLAKGDALNMRAFQRFRECERTGHWPGYTEGVVELDIPDWPEEAALVALEPAA